MPVRIMLISVQGRRQEIPEDGRPLPTMLLTLCFLKNTR